MKFDNIKNGKRIGSISGTYIAVVYNRSFIRLMCVFLTTQLNIVLGLSFGLSEKKYF